MFNTHRDAPLICRPEVDLKEKTSRYVALLLELTAAASNPPHLQGEDPLAKLKLLRQSD
jgi:hypothetical protein